jgi:hypothetical protein
MGYSPKGIASHPIRLLASLEAQWPMSSGTQGQGSHLTSLRGFGEVRHYVSKDCPTLHLDVGAISGHKLTEYLTGFFSNNKARLYVRPSSFDCYFHGRLGLCGPRCVPTGNVECLWLKREGELFTEGGWYTRNVENRELNSAAFTYHDTVTGSKFTAPVVTSNTCSQSHCTVDWQPLKFRC